MLTQKIDIIDVREPNEVAQGIIPSAVNVPLSEFSAAFDVNSESVSSTDFERRFSFPRPTYDHEIVFYCRSGRRSQEALEIARQRGWWKYVGSTHTARATTLARGPTGSSTKRITRTRTTTKQDIVGYIIHCP